MYWRYLNDDNVVFMMLMEQRTNIKGFLMKVLDMVPPMKDALNKVFKMNAYSKPKESPGIRFAVSRSRRCARQVGGRAGRRSLGLGPRALLQPMGEGARSQTTSLYSGHVLLSRCDSTASGLAWAPC